MLLLFFVNASLLLYVKTCKWFLAIRTGGWVNHTHTHCCLGQDLSTNMQQNDIDLQMTLTFNIVL